MSEQENVPQPERTAEALPASVAQPASAVEGGEFRQLDPRVVRLWHVTGALGFGFIFVPLFLVLGSGFLAEPKARVPIAIVLMILAMLFVYLVLMRPPRRYRSWGYRIDGRVLEMKSGLLVRSHWIVPLPRLQHVDLRRGPFERRFGLASLVLVTAGVHHAVHVIPGLEAGEAARLRDHLLEMGGDDGV